MITYNSRVRDLFDSQCPLLKICSWGKPPRPQFPLFPVPYSPFLFSHSLLPIPPTRYANFYEDLSIGGEHYGAFTGN